MTTVTFGELDFELRESARRRTVEIIVERDGSLVLATPPEVPVEKLERIVDQRRFWIHSKLIKKEAAKPAPDQKTYLPGEGFYYLGRSYRLKLVDQAQTPLRLHQGRFELLRSQQDQGRYLFIQWYRQHLKPYLEAIANPLLPRVGAEPATVQVRELGNRWGSCSPKGDVYFHWRVALLPRAMIEYVVIHEMVHLVEPHHNAAFWDRVERILPSWQERKDWLARNGATYDL